MAARRMFGTDFIFSDKFSELTHAGQVLYFNLMGSADDDGFVNRAKRVIKDCNCEQKDLDMLIHQGYLMAFDSGIVVIRHWFQHNRIRKDRYTETIHLEEKAKLELKNEVYEWMIVEDQTETEMMSQSKTRGEHGEMIDAEKNCTEQDHIEDVCNEKESKIQEKARVMPEVSALSEKSEKPEQKVSKKANREVQGERFCLYRSVWCA